MNRLLEHGSILYHRGIYDPGTKMHTTAPVEIPPSNPDYEKFFDWLSGDQLDRAEKILAAYRTKHPKAS